MSINQQLHDLYSEHWGDLLSQLDDEKNEHTNPLLICIDEEKLANADIKVMIFGQETKGWWDKDGFTRSINVGMDRYKKFFCDEGFYPGYKRSAYWKGFRFFQKELNKHNKGKKIIYIWNNISKIGKANAKTGVIPRIRAIERNSFPVIKKEVDIIKPDIMIFLTGPNRDHDIKFHFSDVKFLNSDTSNTQRQLAKVSSKYLPPMSIRMYHPSFFKGFNTKLKSNAIKLLTTASSK
jgi:hypothetical protein